MMEMRMNKGSLKITDDNKTVVSSDIAKEIQNNYQPSDKAEDGNHNKPDLTIKD